MSKKDQDRLKELNKEIPYYEKLMSSSTTDKESYQKILDGYQREKAILEDKLVSKGMMSKGICNLSDFHGKPILTVSIDKSHNKRNLYDSVRGGWKVTEVMSANSLNKMVMLLE